MGNSCVGSLSPEQKAARKRDKQIEEQNRNSFEKEAQKIKLLLLGAGESGKSTLFKQMRILYGCGDAKGFTAEERREMAPVVRQNVLFNFKQLLRSPIIGVVPDSETNSPSNLSSDGEKTALKLLNTNTRNANECEINIAFANELKTLWLEKSVQKAWKNRGSLQVQDALEFFMRTENIARVSSSEYVASDQDILFSRVRTSGVVEEQFQMDGSKFLLVDVGGQRNERRKWIHAFADVDCVLFVAAISEFDQLLYEDGKTSRQEESINLFKKVSNEAVLGNCALLLFLNKTDLFRKKLLTAPFRVEGERNEEYSGPVVEMIKSKDMSEEDFEKTEEFEEIFQQSLQFVEQLYRKKAPAGRQIFVKSTCATDTQQVRHIMDACKEIFLRRHLRSGGFV